MREIELHNNIYEVPYIIASLKGKKIIKSVFWKFFVIDLKHEY